jgi:hypothetical protein
MMRVPVDAAWVRRMAELADVRWTDESVTAMFERYGWTGAYVPAKYLHGAEGPCLIWNELIDLFSAPDQKIRSGWSMFLYDPPPSEKSPEKEPFPWPGAALFCASFWPGCGEEDPGPLDPASCKERDEVLAFGKEGAAWIVEPEARRAAFIAEFDRIHALVRDLLGEPSQTMREDDGVVRAIWDRGAMVLALVMEPNADNYQMDDWLVLHVAPKGFYAEA